MGESWLEDLTALAKKAIQYNQSVENSEEFTSEERINIHPERLLALIDAVNMLSRDFCSSCDGSGVEGDFSLVVPCLVCNGGKTRFAEWKVKHGLK